PRENLPMRLARLAHVIARHRWPVIGIWLVLTLFGAFAAGKVSKRWFQSFSIPGYSAYETSKDTLERFGTGQRPPNIVVFQSHGDSGGPSVLLEAFVGGLGALVILLFVFGTLPAIAMPIAVAVAAILNTFTLVWALTYVTNVSIIVQFLIALVGLGVAIDYA